MARRWGLRIPDWVESERRFLDRPYFVDEVEHLKPFYLAESPLAFRRRLVFTEIEPLRRARFPRQDRVASDGE